MRLSADIMTLPLPADWGKFEKGGKVSLRHIEMHQIWKEFEFAALFQSDKVSKILEEVSIYIYKLSFS